MKRVRIVVMALILAALAGLVTGCASTHEVAKALTVMNQPDSFSLHIGSMESFSHRLRYDWQNSGSKAVVRQASSITGGVARVEVRDPSGHLVHSKSLGESGSFITPEGKPGTWRITLILGRASGSVTFEVGRSG